MLFKYQVKESLFQRCLEVEQTAREQATDNVILDQLQKVSLKKKHL
jgi:trigger factor